MYIILLILANFVFQSYWTYSEKWGYFARFLRTQKFLMGTEDQIFPTSAPIHFIEALSVDTGRPHS